MTIATGFAAIRAFFQLGDFIEKEGADYKNRTPGSKAKRLLAAVNLSTFAGETAFASPLTR
jgi:hypothetical protein